MEEEFMFIGTLSNRTGRVAAAWTKRTTTHAPRRWCIRQEGILIAR